MTPLTYFKSKSHSMDTSDAINAPAMTPAQVAEECRVIYETRIAILREPEGCGGDPTPEQVQIALDEVMEFKRLQMRPVQAPLL